MKKETDLRSHGVTLYIPSFGITMSSNSYIGSDRLLQTVADLWELHRNSTDKEKVLLCRIGQRYFETFKHNKFSS